MSHPTPATPALLLERLQAIAAALEGSTLACTLLGLGSVGAEHGRLDAFSDLDFFVVARPGQVAALLDDLWWLETARPVVYRLRNTEDGFKVLYADGMYAEFAVFEATRLPDIAYVNARVVWAAEDLAGALPLKRHPPVARPGQQERERRLGEALTNLLVGVRRFVRGERLSAFQFTQQHALWNVLSLVVETAGPQPSAQHSGEADPFGPERRFEARFPLLAGRLPACAPGLDASPQAALALLDLLEDLNLPELSAARPLAQQVRREATQAAG